MIIVPNGFVRANVSTGGGFSENGNPVPVVDSWQDKIPCRIQTNNYDKRGKYQDGKFTQCSYLVFVQGKLYTDKIKLTIDDKETEFTVQSIEYLSLVGQTKITV